MPRGARIRVYCAGVVLLFVSLVGKAQYQVIGSAYDLEDGRHLYSEYHSCADDDSKCVVDYRDTAGQLIASKKLNYAAGLTQPSLIFKDHRTGVDTRIASQYQDGLVVDAGFDNFLRSQWEVLVTGDTVRFPFLVPGFDEPLKMRVSVDPSISCAAEKLCLEIRPDSWMLGLLADPINLIYSRDNRRLLRYQGLSNIRGENRESLLVDIEYQYEAMTMPTERAGLKRNSRYSF